MQSKDLAAYVPVAQEMADTAIAFLAEQGYSFPQAYDMPELRLSLEKRVKVHGIYNKKNVLAELWRLKECFAKESNTAGNKGPLIAAEDFLGALALFLNSTSSQFGSMQDWQHIKQEFALLEENFPGSADEGLSTRLKLWQQLVRLLAKVQQLQIKQPLSGVFSSEGRITLYMNNIEAICREQGLDMKAYMQSVLVHEYAHACHYAAFMEARTGDATDQYAMARSMLSWSGAYCGKSRAAAVKESLARYMQILWCYLNEPELATRLEAEDYGEYVICPNWPYAGAQTLLMSPRDEAVALFGKIWQASLVDWVPAYELLSPEPENVE